MIDPSEFNRLHLSVDDTGAIVTLRLDHGKANEMGTQELAELDHLAARLEVDPDARALITWSERHTSRGTPIFVAGANVTERVGWSDDRVATHVRYQRALLARLRLLPMLHVVVVHGVAFGWGTELLLTADVALATSAARFALPETGLGIVPGAGGTSELWARIGPRQALRLGLTGEVLQADEARELGLVDAVYDNINAAMTRAKALAARAATRSPTANAAFKRALLSSIGQPSSVRAALEADAYQVCVDGGDAAIGRAHFAEGKRDQPVVWGPRSASALPG